MSLRKWQTNHTAHNVNAGGRDRRAQPQSAFLLSPTGTRLSRAYRCLVAFAVFLVACQPTANDSRITVHLWALGKEGEAVQSMMQAFTERHPQWQVRVQQIPWSAAHEKLLTAFAGDALPDVIQMGNTWLPEFVALNALRPLGPASAAPLGDDFFPGATASVTLAGQTYAAPWYMDTRVLFYRKDLLREAGIDAPPTTWADWLEALQTLKSHLDPKHFPLLLPLEEWETPIILAMQLGAGLLRDDFKYADFRSAEATEAFKYYLNLFENGFAPANNDAQAGNLYQEFARGQIAMYVSGPWNIAEFALRLPPVLQSQWDTAPLPAPDAHHPGLSIAGGSSLAITQRSAHPDAALALVKFLLEPQQQLAFYALTGDLPSRPSTWLRGRLEHEPHVTAFWKQLQNTTPAPPIPEWERIAAKIGYYVASAIRKERTLDEALHALNSDVDALLDKRRWLRGRTTHP